MIFNYRIELEQSILGACLIERDAYVQVADILTPINFTLTPNKKIYEVLQILFPKKPINILTVSEHLPEYRIHILNIIAQVVSASSLRYHAAALVEFSLRDSFVSKLSKLNEPNDIARIAIQDIIKEASDIDNDILKVVDLAESYLAKFGETVSLRLVAEFKTKFSKKVNRIRSMATVDTLLDNLASLPVSDNEKRKALVHLSNVVKKMLSTDQKLEPEKLKQILSI